MNILPKPKYCGQNWLDMKPTERGRLCGQCQKNIIDFSKKSWTDIIRIQRENNNSVCGMYSDKQLKYWGQEIPRSNIATKIATTTLLIGISTISVNGQTEKINDTTSSKTIIRGFVTGKTENGAIDTLFASNIHLKNTNFGTTANLNGYYELDISDIKDTIKEDILVFSMIGYEDFEVSINAISNNFNFNVQLKEAALALTYFYVKKP